MERKIRNQNGITIISLVITIIAMIIIASISIKMGLSSIKSAQDTTIETNLEIVQQAVTQQYSKAKTLNNLDVEADMTLEMEEIKKQQPSSFIGTPLEKDKLKERVEKLPNVPDLINVDNTYTYENTNYEDMYYLVSGTELKELGIDVGDGQEYIVNYSTGEVLDVTNESFTSGDPAYINGFTTVLDVEDEAFVDTPIHISIYEDLAKIPNGYKFSIKVTDEVAKITPEGVPEGNTPTSNDIENDPDDLNKNDVITENIKITGTDPDNPITDGVTIVKKVVPDSSQGIEEHYIYEIVIDDTKVDPTNPVIKIEILPDSVIDDEDNGNAITELTTSDDSVNVEDVQFDFTLGNVKYFAKDLEGNLIDGVTDVNNEMWGYSASLDLILSTNEKRGLNRQTYIFDYIWSIDSNLDWSSAKQVSIEAKQGGRSAKANIYLEGYTGKGTLYVKPSSNMHSAAGNSVGEDTIKSINLNLDSTSPECEFLYEKTDGSYGNLDEYVKEKNSFFRLTPKDNISYKFVPEIKTIIKDNESGLKADGGSADNPYAYFSTGIFKDINSFFISKKNNEDIYPGDYSVLYNMGWYPMDKSLKKAERNFTAVPGYYYPDSVSGEYQIIVSKDMNYLEEYIVDITGNKSSGNSLSKYIKIDFYAPTISEITILDDGSAIFSVIDDYSGFVSNKSELETIYSKIKYAWIKETTIPDNVEWKSITNEQIKQSVKNSTTNNIGELKIDVGTPEDTETYYLAVKLDNLADIAGNVVNTEIVSKENSKKDLFDFEIENLELQAEDVAGNVIDGVMIKNELWGKTATFNISLISTGRKGLKSGRYIFEYIWTEDENYEWNSSETKRTFVNVTSDGIDKVLTNQITLSSYTGKGYLYVKPYSDDYESGSGLKLNSTPKKVKINLDNTPPEFYLKFKNEKGVYDDISKHISDNDHFFRKGAFSQPPIQQYTYLEPNVIEGINDFDSGIDLDLSVGNVFIEKDEYEKIYTDEEKEAIIEELARSDDFHGKMQTELGTGRERNGEILSYRLKNSGEYYYILRSFVQGTGNVIDKVGNKVTESYVAGPIKLDLHAPEVKTIFRDDFDNAQILLTDDYSGLTNDYSKIKYAWVENKEDTPTVWNTVKSSNVTIKNYTAYNKPSELNIKADMPNEAGNWYLAVKIEGYEDIAGNKAGSDIKFSDDTYGLATDLQIEVFEEPGLEQIKEVKIKITSETGKLFKIKSISYEHKGLNDKQEIITGDLEVTREYISNYHSTVNGPIIVTVEGINGQFYTKEYIVKNVQGLILNYDISETEFWLPIWSSNIDDEHLIYVDWNKLSNEHEGSYVVNNLFDVNTIEVEVEKTIDDEIVYEIEERSELTFNSENVAIHNYNSPGKKQIEITGVFADIDYNNDYGALNDKSFRGKYYTEDSKNRIHEFYQKIETSRNSLKEIVQFGWQIGGINNEYCKKTNATTNFYCCKNLTTIPEVESEEAVETDINVRVFKELTSMDRTFYGSGITKFDHKFLYKSNNLSSMTSTFEKCGNLTYFHKDALKNCGNLKNFIGVFCESSLSSITDEEGLLTDEEGFISGDFFANNDLLMNVSTAFKLTKIKKVASNLFENKSKLQYVNGTFEGSLLEEIPSTLFATNKKLLQANDTFEGTKIFDDPENPEHVGIPKELFYNNPDLEEVRDTFRNTSISVIPKELFEKNGDLHFAEGTFAKTKIKSIPEDLFKENFVLASVKAVFEESLLESIPSNIFKSNTALINVSYAFSKTKINAIPIAIFKNNTGIKYLNGTFSHTLIPTISNEIFLPVIDSAEEFESLFASCKDLKIDNNEGLFEGFEKVETFKSVFADCRNLTVIPKNLFNGCSSVQNFSFAFYVTGIEKVERKILFGEDAACKDSVVDATNMFANCYNLQTVDNVFENFTKLGSIRALFLQDWNLKTVSGSAFKGCTSLYDISGAFFQCGSLYSFGADAFNDCKNNISYLSIEVLGEQEIDGVKYKTKGWWGAFEACEKLPEDQLPPLYKIVPIAIPIANGNIRYNYNSFAKLSFQLDCEHALYHDVEWEVVNE